jgi:hypothetical protein
VILSVVVGACAAAACVTPAWATTQAPVKTVRYRGYSMRVPRSWPVFRLASDPSACVRFDRHAVYLGDPSSQQRCPTHAVGHTEAILVEPLAAAAARSGTGGAAALPDARSAGSAGSASSAGSRASMGELAVPARGVIVTATWAKHPKVIERALGVRQVPGENRDADIPAATAAAVASAPRAAAHPDAAAARVRSDAVNVGGLGFDTCSAPSPAAMAAWLTASPFRAAALYIGGANSACSQPNLSATYVSAESAAGWQFIPVYVGLQAPGSDCGCSEIVPAQASAEGTAAAVDAVAQAEALGIDSGNPIYDDMEAYTRSTSNTAAVLAFLDAWTTELHAYGYVSGVYGSGTSGITDLVDAVGTYTPAGTAFVEPDDLWIADWNNEATATDPYVPAGDWAGNQRLHQYEGGHIDDYGGVKLDIDSDYLDGATATAGVGTNVPTALPDGTFVSYGGKTYRLAGGAPLYVHSWSPFGGAQPTIALSQVQWQALAAVPANGTFIRATGTGKVYRIAGGAPVYVPSFTLFGGAQPTVVVDRWNIENISSSLSHMSSAPSTGTVVEGIPSGKYWVFGSGGWRAETAASASAVGVADTGLTPFLESATVTRDTLSGVAKRAPTLRIVLTAGADAPAFKSFVLAMPRGLSFSGSATTLADHVVVWSATGKPLESVAKVSHGELTITLAAATRKVLITVASPALAATKALAAQVRTGVASTLAVTVNAINAKRERQALSLDPRMS